MSALPKWRNRNSQPTPCSPSWLVPAGTWKSRQPDPPRNSSGVNRCAARRMRLVPSSERQERPPDSLLRAKDPDLEQGFRSVSGRPREAGKIQPISAGRERQIRPPSIEKYAGRFALPHRHAIGIARSDRALGEAAEKPPLARHPRQMFLVGLPVQIDRADRQIGIAQMKKAKPEQHLLTAFEAQLGRHGEIDRAPAGAQLRRREVGPGLLHPACRRQTPSPELTPSAARP